MITITKEKWNLGNRNGLKRPTTSATPSSVGRGGRYSKDQKQPANQPDPATVVSSKEEHVPSSLSFLVVWLASLAFVWVCLACLFVC